MLTEAIKKHSRPGAFQMLMLHTDVEGHQTHPIPALSVSALKELKQVTDYVGLGHTHMHYEIDNWAFNPGSIEVTNISEFRETRGVFVVEVDENDVVSARHIQDYHQRPFKRLSIELTQQDSADDVAAKVAAKVREKDLRSPDGVPQPIVEITLLGRLGFPNSLLDLKAMRADAAKAADALHVRMRNNTVPMEFAVAEDVSEDAGREVLEHRVLEDLIFRDNRFKDRAADVAKMIVGVKRQALTDDSPDKIAEAISQSLFNESIAETREQ